MKNQSRPLVSRQRMISLHLILGSLFLPLMLLMPFTGSSYIWGWQGSQEKTEAFRITSQAPEEQVAQEAFFRDVFKKQNIDFDFEYIRGGKGEFTFRPVTREHYTAKQEGAEIIFTRVKPSLMKRLIELHKGHGPTLMRWFESAFGVALILVALSGVWLAITIPTYRKQSIMAFAVGTAIIALCLF